MSFNQKPTQRVRVSFEGDPGLTEQSHKDECDIHNILKKADKTGILEHVNTYKGSYGTMPTGTEYHDHMNIIAEADSMFESLPAKTRNLFENDPAKYLDFMQDNNNYEKIEKMGLDVSHLKKPEKKIEPQTEPEKSAE